MLTAHTAPDKQAEKHGKSLGKLYLPIHWDLSPLEGL
jgi:hypothetical protein